MIAEILFNGATEVGGRRKRKENSSIYSNIIEEVFFNIFSEIDSHLSDRLSHKNIIILRDSLLPWRDHSKHIHTQTCGQCILKTIVLIRIPSHTGMKGNEIVDIVAKDVLTLPNIIVNLLPLSNQKIMKNTNMHIWFPSRYEICWVSRITNCTKSKPT